MVIIMRVAILGAGLSGLSCAFQLEKYGITPIVFEKKGYIGDSRCTAGIYLNNLSRLFLNPFSYLNKKYKLELFPLNSLKRVTINSPSKKAVIKGKEGYIFQRGPKENSIENQIFKKIKTPINLSTLVTYDSIKNHFDYIVVATGDENIARELGVWEDTYNTYTRIAIIKGRFDKTSAMVWFNTEFCKSGFAFLIPESSKSANLGLVVNDTTPREINYYWKQFLETQNLDFIITETKESKNSCGYINTKAISYNTYFVGNTGGLTDSFIGIGAINAIESGILAGEAIANKLSYNQLIKPMLDHNTKINELRRLMNLLNNKDFDNIVNFIKLPLAKRMIYQNQILKASMLTPIVKYINEKNY